MDTFRKAGSFRALTFFPLVELGGDVALLLAKGANAAEFVR